MAAVDYLDVATPRLDVATPWRDHGPGDDGSPR